MYNRRQFLKWTAGGLVAVGGCTTATKTVAPPPTTSGPTGPTGPTSTGPTSTVRTTTTTTTVGGPATTAASVAADPILVVVQLNGGNDGLNTLVPADGRYRDLRPGLAVPEADVLALRGVSEFGLHPALAPLLARWERDQLAFVEGIGFPDPDRSHFVSMDRWWRADDLGTPAGWLGRVLDGLATEPVPLYATALGSGAPLLNGATVQPTVVRSAAEFRWLGLLDASTLSALAAPPATAPLAAAAQHAMARTIEAVADVAALAGGDGDDDIPEREGGATLTAGLATAAQLVTGGLGTRLVVVSAGGFDTHANQAATHTRLLDDLATGLTAFLDAVEAAGMADRVLVVTTSEFGRRAAENGSGGCDHGAGGVSMLLGPMVRSGVHGALDLGDLLDGDVRPVVDPRTLYTACLDWVGADAEQVLGRRHDEVALLRG